MAVYDLTQTQFLGTIEPNFDSATQDQILNYLHNQGIYPGGAGTAAVQLDVAPPLAPPASTAPAGHDAQISVFTSTNFSVNTDANATIKAIIANSLNSTVNLGGQASVLLAAGNGNDTLIDVGSGNSSLLGGSGNDNLNASGTGNDTLSGAAGNDTLVSPVMATP